MTSTKLNNRCRRIRTWIYEAMNRRFGPEASWLHNHIMYCPRCQQRLVASGKVNLALSFMKSQPHALDLLMRANTQAITVLKHSLRSEPKAQELERKLPGPKLLERCSLYGHSAVNLAACILILFLMKIGVFSFMDSFQTQGQKVLKQYYVNQVGADLADDIFAKDAESSSYVNSDNIVNA